MPKLGYKVLFIDSDGCNAIRKGVITCVKDSHGYVDFLSANPTAEYRGRSYTVCAVKGGDHVYFEVDNVFQSDQEVKEFLADLEFSKYDLFD